MQTKAIKKYFLLFFLNGLIFQSVIFGQIHRRENLRLNNIFHKIERSINNGDVQGISRYFSNRVLVSLPNNVNSYFSSNHLFYLLKDYFSVHRAMYFSFDNISVNNLNPYGYGSFTYQKNGERESSTIYISFSKFGKAWKITQLTVN